jgi:hypothetical protein
MNKKEKLGKKNEPSQSPEKEGRKGLVSEKPSP